MAAKKPPAAENRDQRFGRDGGHDCPVVGGFCRIQDRSDPVQGRERRIDNVEGAPLSLPGSAQVAELVDALVSGTSGESRGGSSPLLGTTSSPQREPQ